jgi:hypothetical protein
MPSVNPGPAITATPNTLAALAPVNTPVSSIPLETNALRLLAVARAVPLTQLGDAAVIPIINSFSFFVQTIVLTNALNAQGQSASAATANVSINTGPAGTGTVLKAAGLLTTLTGQQAWATQTVATAGTLQTATMGPAGTPSNFLYVNVGVVSAAAATADVFIYGYDIS